MVKFAVDYVHVHMN